MRTSKMVELEQPRQGKRQFVMIGALVVALAIAGSVRAATNDVSDALQAGLSTYVEAAVLAQAGDLPGVAAALNEVQDWLNQAKADLASVPELDPVKFAKQIDGALKKLTGVQTYIASGSGNSTSRVKKISSAAKSLQKLANTAGTPLLVEVNAKTAGFHKVGELVLMAFAIPEGCTDWNIQHTDSDTGVLADFTVDRATGEIQVMMGSVGGSSRVTVTGCGLPPEGKSWFLYNYGPKPVAGLPEGFPTGLTSGNYQMIYSGNVTCTGGGGYNIPATPLGVFAFGGDAKKFYSLLKTAMDAAVSAVSQPGCTQGVAYSPFNGASFNCTLTVSCTSCGPDGCATCTSHLIFTYNKL